MTMHQDPLFVYSCLGGDWLGIDSARLSASKTISATVRLTQMASWAVRISENMVRECNAFDLMQHHNAIISQTTFSNGFSSMKMFEFRFKFHWSLFERVQLTIFQHWFRSIYLRVYSLHHNVLPTLQSIPLMTNGLFYPITQDFSCHGQHTMPRNP